MSKTMQILFFGVALGVSCSAAAAWSDVLDVLARGRDETRLRVLDLHELVEVEARRNGLSPAYVAAILQIESAGQPCAVSHANAAGLMQIMPSVARRYGVYDRFDPRENIAAGTAHLAEALRLASGDARRGAAVYNFGAKALSMPEWRWPEETRRYSRKLPQLLPLYAGENWRNHLTKWVPRVNTARCLARSS